MPVRATLLSALLFSLLKVAHGQPLPDMPPPPMLMFDENAVRGRNEVSLATMNPEWRKFIMKDRRVDPRGFLAVVVPARFLGPLDAVKAAPVFKPVRAGENTPVSGLELLGRIQESKNRTEYLFGTSTTARALLTAWKFKEDGGSINVVRDFLNQNIDGTPATLSLATAANSKQCHWKLVAVDDKVSYEVVIADTLNEQNEAAMTVAQVLATAKELIGFARKKNQGT